MDISECKETEGSERTYGNLKWAENEAPRPKTSSLCPGCLPGVSVHLLQLLISLSIILLLATILFHTVSRTQQALGSENLAHQRGQSAGCLCRPCPLEWEFFQGSCYWVSRIRNDWASAESACQHRNAHLVVVNSEPEEKFLQSWKVRIKKRAWIGLSNLHNGSTWRWVDGTPLQLSFWQPKQPNSAGNESCVVLFDNGWNDLDCNGENVWICEKPEAPCASL